MHISHGTQHKVTASNNGYGYATENIIASLERLGHSVTQNDPTADVQIWFDQPHHWKWNKGQYRIGYLPWESTHLHTGWHDIMNNTDEIWTPSHKIAKWFREDGIRVPIHVYEHGVSPDWTPVEKSLDGPMVFGNFGGEAVRKSLHILMPTFRAAFHDKPKNDVKLVLKMQNPNWNIPDFGRIQVINNQIPLPELIKLMQSFNAYVYPSYGEGFSLTPLQALATATPVITTPATVCYEQYLEDNLCVDSTLRPSPWQKLHPGKMYAPDKDSLIDALRYAYDNRQEVTQRAAKQRETLMQDYDWDTLTKRAFTALESRLRVQK